MLFSDFNTLQFASVMALVVFVTLLMFMVETRPYHHGIGVDLPKVVHPISMINADREDAMTVIITRDGHVFFGADQVSDVAALGEKIQHRLEDRTIERKVYIKADMRARWGSVKKALEGVRAAEVVRVAFLVNQRSR